MYLSSAEQAAAAARQEQRLCCLQEDTLSTTDERVGVPGEVLPVRAPGRLLARPVLADLSLPVHSLSAMPVCMSGQRLVWPAKAMPCLSPNRMFCLTWPCIESLLTLQSS